MRIKLILITIVIIIVGIIYFVSSSIGYYVKQNFYSDSAIIIKSFEYEVVSGRYSTKDEKRYVMLKDLDININSNDFDLNNSYIVFGDEDNNLVYISTILGKGRFKDYAYINTNYEDMDDMKNIVKNNNIETTKLLKELNVKSY